MVIDTGKDYNKIASDVSQLKQIAWYTHDICKHKSDVALERNKMRPRQVPEKIVIDSWN